MATEPVLTDTLKSVYDILKDAGRNGMHVSDIAAEAVQRNTNMGLSAEAFQEKIQAALDTSAMAVDAGVDIVVSKNDKYFHIQVKTATENNGRFGFSIRTNAFERNHNSSMFYIFVLRQGLNNEFIIMPSSYIQALVASGKINKGTTLPLSIVADFKKRKYQLNNSVNLDVYVGNFGVIV